MNKQPVKLQPYVSPADKMTYLMSEYLVADKENIDPNMPKKPLLPTKSKLMNSDGTNSNMNTHLRLKREPFQPLSVRMVR